MNMKDFYRNYGEYVRQAGYGLLVICIVVSIGMGFLSYKNSQEMIIIRIDDKETEYDSEDGTTYYIYSIDETFSISTGWGFSVPPLYKQLKTDKLYEVGVIGWSVPRIMHRTINCIYREIKE